MTVEQLLRVEVRARCADPGFWLWAEHEMADLAPLVALMVDPPKGTHQ